MHILLHPPWTFLIGSLHRTRHRSPEPSGMLKLKANKNIIPSLTSSLNEKVQGKCCFKISKGTILGTMQYDGLEPIPLWCYLFPTYRRFLMLLQQTAFENTASDKRWNCSKQVISLLSTGFQHFSIIVLLYKAREFPNDFTHLLHVRCLQSWLLQILDMW